MAEEALNKSLDDLIAEQRKKSGPAKPKPQLRTRVRQEAPPAQQERRGPPARRAGRTVQVPKNLSITIRNAGVQKARGPPRQGNARPDTQAPEKRLAALEGGAKWGHDMYDGPSGGGGFGRGPRGIPNPRAPTMLGTKLFVSNLDYSVSDDDIKELFGSVGKLVKAGVQYDASGRSEGQAEIIFENEADAQRAMDRYNNIQLDGQPMQIELIPKGPPTAAAGGAPRTLRSGIRVSGERGGRLVGATRGFQQALGGATRNPRGRGSVHGTAAMDME